MDPYIVCFIGVLLEALGLMMLYAFVIDWKWRLLVSGLVILGFGTWLAWVLPWQ